jgi:hypothetical protein
VTNHQSARADWLDCSRWLLRQWLAPEFHCGAIEILHPQKSDFQPKKDS